MRSNAAPQPVLQSYKETRSNCPDPPDKLSGPTATTRGWGKLPKDVMRSDLTPVAKLVFAVIASELYRRETVEMTQVAAWVSNATTAASFFRPNFVPCPFIF